MTSPLSILLIVSDSLRADFAGQAAARLGAFEREAVVFEECIAQGISTAPSMTAMLTSTFPLDYGGHWYLHADRPAAAEVFRANGFRTAAIHSNPNVSRLRNFHKGFDLFDEELLPAGVRALMRVLPTKTLPLANKFFRLLRPEPYLTADRLNAKARRWLNEQDGRPTFLWMQYMDTHGPYVSHRGFRYYNKLRAELLWHKAAVRHPEAVTPAETAELLSTYREEIAYTDAAFGRLLDWLRATGRLDHGLIVFAADHGDEFGEHGYYGHINSPFEELIRVPLIVRFPGGRWGGTRLADPVRLIDLVPTLLDYAGLWPDPPRTDLMAGQSLLPWARSERRGRGFEFAITEKHSRKGNRLQIGLRGDEWKYIHDDWRGVRELYNFKRDPAEKQDVAAQYPEIVRAFEVRLAERLQQIEARASRFAPVQVEESPEVADRLRALGYLD